MQTCAEGESDEEEDVEAAFLAEAEEGAEEDEFEDGGSDVEAETEALVDIDGITDTLRVDDGRADEGNKEELEGNNGVDLGHESVAAAGSHQSHHKRLVSSVVVMVVSVDVAWRVHVSAHFVLGLAIRRGRGRRIRVWAGG